MRLLPLANLMHHKLRSALSALGIGAAVCMLITLSGLARGSLYEIADRWEGIHADLLVFPSIWGDNITTISGVAIPDKEGQRMLKEHPGLVENVIPAFLWRMELAGQDQVVVGVDSDESQWLALTGGRRLVAGNWCDADGAAARWLTAPHHTAATSQAATDPAAIAESSVQPIDLGACLAEHGGLEMVIDQRLARAMHKGVGDEVIATAQKWKIVGIAPEGVLARVFIPRRTAQFLFGDGNTKMSTLMFVKTRGDDSAAAAALRTPARQAVSIRQYRAMLQQKYGVMFRYVDAVNAFALVIAFLFILVTLYTMVLQRTREIAILKACGASNGFIVRQVLAESLLLSAAGALAGVAMSFPAAWGIQKVRPLLTVTITPEWMVIGVAAAVAGAVVSGLYPAWRAARVDVGEALSLE